MTKRLSGLTAAAVLAAGIALSSGAGASTLAGNNWDRQTDDTSERGTNWDREAESGSNWD